MACGETTIVGRLHETSSRACHYNLSSFEDVVEGDQYESSVSSLKAFVERMDGTDDAGLWSGDIIGDEVLWHRTSRGEWVRRAGDTIPDGFKDATYLLPISKGTIFELARVFPCPERANYPRYGCSSRTVVELKYI